MSGNLQKKRGKVYMREVDLFLFNADWLLTCDSNMSRFRSGAVAIQGDRLVGIGTSNELRKSFRGCNEIDLSGHLLMPGLVNTHTHAAMSLFRGLEDDLPLDRWLLEVIFPMEAEVINRDTVHLGALLSILEMLKGGVTTFCDGYFFEEAAATAALASGIRAVLGQGIIDFPTPDQPNPAESQKRAETFLSRFPTQTDRIRPSLFCHAPYTCGPETLKWAKQLCRGNNILFQTHLSETAREVETIKERYGQTPAAYLEGLGILDELTLCAHGVWLSQAEIKTLAENRVSLSHCPESNMKLGSGVAPISDLMAAGVQIGLGTDGCASNNNLDLFSEMDKTAKMEKVFRKNPLANTAEQVLKMATIGGASALGLGRETGSLELGKKADIIALSINQPHLLPMYDPVSHLVYSANGSDVRYVWVDGKQVVADGFALSIDEADVISEAKRVGVEIITRLNRSGIKV
jgi:5-methylthioadenosine/S-adenosylhomocysteine deaminase